MVKYLKIGIFILILAGIVASKFLFFPKEQTGVGPQAGPRGMGAPTSVNFMVLQPENVSNVLYASGSVLANERVELSSESAGRVIGIYFKEGAFVTQGSLLVKLNDADIKAQLEKAKVSLQLADDRAKRQEKLLAVQGTSKEDYEITQNQVLSIKADIRYFESLMEKTEIRAPFSGIIGIRNIALGSYLNPGMVISTLQQLNPIKIEFSVPEKYLALLKPGQKIRYNFEGGTADQYATVQIISPDVNLETRSILVRATGENKTGLLPGNFVRVYLDLADKTDVIKIPTSSVVPILKGQKVYVIEGGVATEKIIEISDRDDQHVLVTSGLNKGDSLITSAIIMMRQGLPVNPLIKN